MPSPQRLPWPEGWRTQSQAPVRRARRHIMTCRRAVQGRRGWARHVLLLPPARQADTECGPPARPTPQRRMSHAYCSRSCCSSRQTPNCSDSIFRQHGLHPQNQVPQQTEPTATHLLVEKLHNPVLLVLCRLDGVFESRHLPIQPGRCAGRVQPCKRQVGRGRACGEGRLRGAGATGGAPSPAAQRGEQTQRWCPGESGARRSFPPPFPCAPARSSASASSGPAWPVPPGPPARMYSSVSARIRRSVSRSSAALLAKRRPSSCRCTASRSSRTSGGACSRTAPSPDTASARSVATAVNRARASSACVGAQSAGSAVAQPAGQDFTPLSTWKAGRLAEDPPGPKCIA